MVKQELSDVLHTVLSPEPRLWIHSVRAFLPPYGGQLQGLEDPHTSSPPGEPSSHMEKARAGDVIGKMPGRQGAFTRARAWVAC